MIYEAIKHPTTSLANELRWFWRYRVKPLARYQKVGGLRFIRLGRLSVSWCIVKRK